MKTAKSVPAKKTAASKGVTSKKAPGVRECGSKGCQNQEGCSCEARAD
ncbi:MAG: hypothetical protein MZV63_55090 [Marinilabiliales bacterium]|nr:hypothetical protein [Marinilabiliales bacterium]